MEKEGMERLRKRKYIGIASGVSIKYFGIQIRRFL
jgi:hypothetical protein